MSVAPIRPFAPQVFAFPPRATRRFAVLQLGARMHYAVPALLKRAGMLQHFYTDAVGNRGMTDVFRRVAPSWAWPAPVKRLLGRCLPPELSRDAVGPADRIETIVCDRALRDRLVQSAHKRAVEYSWAHYQERLLAALEPPLELREQRAA